MNILLSPVRAQTVGKSDARGGVARSLDRDFLDGYKGHCQQQFSEFNKLK